MIYQFTKNDILIIFTLSLPRFVLGFLSSMVIPIFPTLINIHFNSSLTKARSNFTSDDNNYYQLSILYVTKNLCQIVLGPITGYVINLIGSLIVLLVGVSFHVPTLLLYGIGDIYTLLLIGRITEAVSTTAINGAIAAFIAVHFKTHKQRGFVFGVSELCLCFGAASGPAFGGYVFEYRGKTASFLSVLSVVVVELGFSIWVIFRDKNTQITIQNQRKKLQKITTITTSTSQQKILSNRIPSQSNSRNGSVARNSTRDCTNIPLVDRESHKRRVANRESGNAKVNILQTEQGRNPKNRILSPQNCEHDSVSRYSNSNPDRREQNSNKSKRVSASTSLDSNSARNSTTRTLVKTKTQPQNPTLVNNNRKSNSVGENSKTNYSSEPLIKQVKNLQASSRSQSDKSTSVVHRNTSKFTANLPTVRILTPLAKQGHTSMIDSGEGKWQNLWMFFKDPYFIILLFVFPLVVVGIFLLYSSLPQYMAIVFRATESQQGIVWISTLLGYALGFFMGNIINTRLSEQRHIMLTVFTYVHTAAMVSIPFMPAWWSLTIPLCFMVSVHMLFEIVLAPILATIVEVDHSSEFGTMAGILITVEAITAALGSFLGPILLSQIGLMYMIIGAGILGFIYAPFFLFFGKFCRQKI